MTTTVKWQEPEYRAWVKMRDRCRNPKHPAFHNYGGRGIVICDAWSTYEAFLNDMGRRPSPHHSLDRKDCDGPYEASNCRWATITEQNRNTRRNTKVLRSDGVLFTSIAEAAEQSGVPYTQLRNRLWGSGKCGNYSWEAVR